MRYSSTKAHLRFKPFKMAARHLQRLRAAVFEKVEEESSSSEDEVVSAKAPFNPFDLLSEEEVIIARVNCFQEVGPRLLQCLRGTPS